MTECVSIIMALRYTRFNFSNESQLQQGIEQMIAGMRAPEISYRREFSLSKKDRVDFYFPSEKIGLEVKVKGSPSDVLEQLLRYAQYDAIAQLILVTSRMRLTDVPSTLNGKPLLVFPIWIQNL